MGTLIFIFVFVQFCGKSIFWMRSCVPCVRRFHLQNQLFVYCDSVFIVYICHGTWRSPVLHKVSLSRNWCERNVYFIVTLWLLHFILNLSHGYTETKKAIKRRTSWSRSCGGSLFLWPFTCLCPFVIKYEVIVSNIYQTNDGSLTPTW